MFVKKNSNYIITTKIEFGTFLGCKEDSEAYVVLREMDTYETLQLKKHTGEEELLMFFKELMPTLIVEHNLFETEADKMTNEDLVKLVFSKINLTTKVFGEYAQNSFQHAK